MRTFTAVVERDQATGLFVGYIPGWPGAHTRGESLDELHANLREVVDMLLEAGDPVLETEFVGTQTLDVASSRTARNELTLLAADSRAYGKRAARA